jgi:hypothetical protein
MGNFNVVFDLTDHIFFIHQIPEKKLQYIEAAHQLFMYFKKTCDSVRKEVLYIILIEFGVPMRLVRLIKIYLNETYNRVRIGKLKVLLPEMV